MCGRFSLFSDPGYLAEHFALSTACEYTPSYNSTPSSNIPVIRLTVQGREAVNCHWGLLPHWARDTRYKPINARAETITEKPFFRDAFRNKRCLFPANGFFEWKGHKGQKQPFFFKLKEAELFAFAGLWDHRERDNRSIDSCTIITTGANRIMQSIHDRMPVILDPEDYDEWLVDGSSTLLVPYPGEMTCFPVSTVVNSPAINGKDLIQPLDNLEIESPCAQSRGFVPR